MQITLASNEIKDAIIAALSGNISLDGKNVSVTFTSGRSRNDLTATVVIETKKADDTVIPGFSDGTAGDNAANLQLVQDAAAADAAKAEQAAGDPVQDAEQHVAPTTGSLFKPGNATA